MMETKSETKEERRVQQPTLLTNAGVKGRLYHLTNGGLIGVRRRLPFELRK
jgi:hypothetical protein